MNYYPPQPVYPNQPAPRVKRNRVGSGIAHAVGFLVVIWAVFIVNYGLFGGQLNYFGVHPLDLGSIWHIATSPLLHGGVEHILSNSIPGMIFCFLIGMSGKRVFWEVTLIAGLIGGIGTWLFGGIGTNHIGASGLVYGWLGYLIVRGFFNRHPGQAVLGIALAFMYGGLIWGVFPGATGVSWQGHLFGAIGGILAGIFITSDDPPQLAAKKQQRKLKKQGQRNNQLNAPGSQYGQYGQYGQAGGYGQSGGFGQSNNQRYKGPQW